MASMSEVKKLLLSYAVRMAETYGAENVKEFFSIAAPESTLLRDALMESDDFLALINMLHVDQLKGQVVVTGAPGLYTGRKKNGRFSRELGNTGNSYELVEIDSGAHLPYHTLAAWANAGSEDEFFTRIQNFVTRSFGHDILRVGFNGTRAAEDTDPETNPMGEDVAPGWHQIVKTRSPGQIVSDEVTLDRSSSASATNFVGLDSLVTDARMNMIIEAYRESPDLVALVSRDLIGEDAVSMMNRIDRPSEKVAAQLINREIGGLKAYSPPFMPSGRVIVTPLWNLHSMTQQGTEYRRAEWVDDRKRWETNYLRMAGYAVEYDELYASFDNVVIPDAPDAP
ncbi:TPA: phage major capsid protein, P2 family [Enterobacter kobei]|nr:phage major capsid protein, P2 family [Enterobacter kobei]